MELGEIPEGLQDRTWYIEGGSYAFLVDAPITLGHAQLKIKTDEGQQEEDSFMTAATHVTKRIAILRRALPDLNHGDWTALAGYTKTAGTYVKTLVLKASADEAKGEYKIHLVPYFDSHLQATTRRHSATQDLDSGKPGGLLHWVGERERLVDHDMRPGRDDKEVKRRITSFRLPELASHLRGNDPSATAGW